MIGKSPPARLTINVNAPDMLLKFTDAPSATTQTIFRWGTHLYVSLFPSVCPSICLSLCLLHTISQELYIIYS